MKYNIKEMNLLAIEGVLKNRDSLLALSLENFELKRSELGMKLSSTENFNEQLIVIKKELELARAVVEQPVAQEYINLGLLKDVDAGIEHLRSYYAGASEAHEKLKILSVFKSTYGMSRDQGIEHLDRLYSRDVDVIVEELQLVVMNIWTWKFYYSILVQFRRDLMAQMLAEEENRPQQSVEDNPKMEWLGTQKNLAELFLELEAKGYIKKIDSDAIKRTFTESNSIHQILKPGYDKRNEPIYEQVYTAKYSPRFDGIRPLLKKRN